MSTWTTRANEEVTCGQLVALSVLRHADAVGLILGAAEGGLIRCELWRGRNIKPGAVVVVEEGQLLTRVYG